MVSQAGDTGDCENAGKKGQERSAYQRNNCSTWPIPSLILAFRQPTTRSFPPHIDIVLYDDRLQGQAREEGTRLEGQQELVVGRGALQ